MVQMLTLDDGTNVAIMRHPETDEPFVRCWISLASFEKAKRLGLVKCSKIEATEATEAAMAEARLVDEKEVDLAGVAGVVAPKATEAVEETDAIDDVDAAAKAKDASSSPMQLLLAAAANTSYLSLPDNKAYLSLPDNKGVRWCVESAALTPLQGLDELLANGFEDQAALNAFVIKKTDHKNPFCPKCRGSTRLRCKTGNPINAIYPMAGYTCRGCNYSFKQYTPAFMELEGLLDAKQKPYLPSQDKPADQKRRWTARSKTADDYKHRSKSQKVGEECSVGHLVSARY